MRLDVCCLQEALPNLDTLMSESELAFTTGICHARIMYGKLVEFEKEITLLRHAEAELKQQLIEEKSAKSLLTTTLSELQEEKIKADALAKSVASKLRDERNTYQAMRTSWLNASELMPMLFEAMTPEMRNALRDKARSNQRAFIALSELEMQLEQQQQQD
jgi:hypothetical protein